MAVRKTESQLPIELGYRPEDLGQVGKLTKPSPAPTTPDCYLISYLSSPITQDSKNTYVVFVTGDLKKQAASYKFLVTYLPLPPIATYTKSDLIGIFEYTPEYEGNIDITVDILDVNGKSLQTITMNQNVKQPNAVIERLFSNSSIGFESPNFGWRYAAGGGKETTREVVNDLKGYIKTAFDAKTNVNKPSSMFLAAVTYLQAFKVPKENNSLLSPDVRYRDGEVKDAANVLNGDATSLFYSRDKPHSLGICQIAPQTLAMILRNPLITWKDLSSGKREEERSEIIKAYNALSEANKIDLYNILRFPKSNISACFDLLDKLKNRDRRYGSMATGDFSMNDKAVQIVATEFDIGGTITPLDQVKSGEFGKKIVPIMHSPYLGIIFYGDYRLKVSGKVVDDEKKAISGARIYIWQTQVQMTDPVPAHRACYKTIDRKVAIELPQNRIYQVLQVTRDYPRPKSVLAKVRKYDSRLDNDEGWVIVKEGDNVYCRLFSERFPAVSTDNEVRDVSTNSEGKFHLDVSSYQPYKLQVVKDPVGDDGYFDGESLVQETGMPSGWFFPPQQDLLITMNSAKYMIRESSLVALVNDWLGYSYGHKPDYPNNYYIDQFVSAANQGNKTIDCSEFVASITTEVCRRAYNNNDKFSWDWVSKIQYEYAMVYKGVKAIEDPFSSIYVYNKRYICVNGSIPRGTSFTITIDSIANNIIAADSKEETAKIIADTINNNRTLKKKIQANRYLYIVVDKKTDTSPAPTVENSTNPNISVVEKRCINILNNGVVENTPFGITINGVVINVVAGNSNEETAKRIRNAINTNSAINANVVAGLNHANVIVLSSIDQEKACDYIIASSNGNIAISGNAIPIVPVDISNNNALPPPWSILQGWGNFNDDDGHTFFIVDVHLESKKVLTLESNQKTSTTIGPGFRTIGNINNCKVGNDVVTDKDTHWLDKVTCSWDSIKAAYNNKNDGSNPLGIVRLKLYDLKWSTPIL